MTNYNQDTPDPNASSVGAVASEGVRADLFSRSSVQGGPGDPPPATAFTQQILARVTSPSPPQGIGGGPKGYVAATRTNRALLPTGASLPASGAALTPVGVISGSLPSLPVGTGGSAGGGVISALAYAPLDAPYLLAAADSRLPNGQTISLIVTAPTPPTLTTVIWRDTSSNPALLRYYDTIGETWLSLQGLPGAPGLPGAAGPPAAFLYQGTWNGTAAYALNDIVIYQGSAYVALAGSTNVTPGTAGGASWGLMAAAGSPAPPINPRGAWASGTAYAIADMVTYSGGSYYCTAATSGTTTPDIDTGHWQQLAAGGTNGTNGTTGATGSTGATGANGTNGTNGSQIYTGSGVPGSGLGVNGDFYLNTANGNYYQKSGGAWGSPLGNLTGPAGATGATGASGATAPDASATTKGITKLSVAPASSSSPIAVGDNDPRIQPATETTLGTMSAADKTKLDALSTTKTYLIDERTMSMASVSMGTQWKPAYLDYAPSATGGTSVNWTPKRVDVYLEVAPSGGSFQVDIWKNGASILTGGLITIAAGASHAFADTTTTVALSGTTLASGDKLVWVFGTINSADGVTIKMVGTE